jgi:hypothetical protein
VWVSFVVGNQFLEVFHTVTGERDGLLFTRSIDPQASILRFHSGANVPEPVNIFA